jgi:mannosyl-3-phosphoglycerate phosphatase
LLKEIDCPNIIIFSDLDGTLLTPVSYRWDRAEIAIELCKNLGIPIVLVSSKTRAEIEIFREEMGLSTPFVSENGGAIFIESDNGNSLKDTVKDGGYIKIELGVSYNLLVEALREIRNRLGWQIKGFSDMSVEEIAYLTNMDLSSAYFASLREYDEPFLILEDVNDLSPLFNLAKDMGLRVFKGGRFFHIQGKNDKGKAIDVLISWYKKRMGKIITVALGDSPNDFPMLKRVDYPILILSDNKYQPVIPRLKISRKLGPEGWNEEVINIIKELCA